MRTRLFLSLLTLLALAPAASAQFEGWYQIEILVFERTGGFDDELWPTDITLRYPLHWQELRDPEAIEAATDAATGGDSAAPLDPAAEADADTPTPDLAREPFYTLPETERHLNQERRRLAAQGNIRVLFHEAWRQPVAGVEQTPSILVFGGETFDQHRRLEGSVHISVARYLHLNTNLWLSDFQINTGQGSPWPEIPLNPVERLKRAESTGDGLLPYAGSQPAATPWAASRQSAWTSSFEEDSLSDFLEAPYLPRRIVTLQQHRRMRSDELHYIDHPRLGLLAIIHPYVVPPQESEEGIVTPIL